MTMVSTEGRIFVAQLTRDLAAREAAGADRLAPGTKTWKTALSNFCNVVAAAKGPVKAAKVFKAGIMRLSQAQRDGACYINCHSTHSRSGGFELLTWEVAKHPLINTGNEGVLVRDYYGSVQRNGCVGVRQSRLAFCSWHALARMRERSSIDLFNSRGIVAGCGLTGLLMRRSSKHANNAIHYATAEHLLCVGVLRTEAEEYSFFDVLTALRPDEEGPLTKQWEQGCAISHAVHKYIKSDDANSDGYAEDIEVLPFRHDDFISRELKRAEHAATAACTSGAEAHQGRALQ